MIIISLLLILIIMIMESKDIIKFKANKLYNRDYPFDIDESFYYS